MAQNSQFASIAPEPEKDQSFILKVLENKTFLIQAILTFIFLGCIVGYLQTKMSQSAEKNLSLVESSLDEQNHLEIFANLKKLITISDKYPSIRPKLDAPLAQECLNQNQLKEGQKLYERVKNRLGSSAILLNQFNEISWLIAENRLEEAYQKSEHLNQLIDNQKYPVMYAYQIIRSAELAKKIGHLDEFQRKIGEYASWRRSNQLSSHMLSLGGADLEKYLNKQIGQ